MDSLNLSFGQKVDDETGLVMPWFTHGALDWIKEQDWKDKKVLQYGSGLGDVWIAKRVSYLVSIERDAKWAIELQDDIQKYDVKNYECHYRRCADNENMQDDYIPFPVSYNTGLVYFPDIIIIDDAYRLDIIKYVLNIGTPFTLIVDNYMQAFVFLNEEAKGLLEKYEHLIFEQHDHEDHDGVNKWKTGIFFISQSYKNIYE